MRLLLLIIPLLLSSCEIQYKFQDVQVGDAETALIRQFAVSAPLAPPTAGQVFTIKLQDVVQSQSKLNLSPSENADIIFDGSITRYTVAPVSVQQGDVSAQNRLTITVNVSFTNKTDSKQDYDQSFTRFADFSSSSDISQVQNDLLDEIYELISQDVFNRAFSNW